MKAICVMFVGAAAIVAHAGVRVDADIAGGNIIVNSIQGARITARPDLRDTEGHWFYWAFRVRDAAGETLRVRFSGPDVMGVRGPAYSLDAGYSWQWLGAASVEGNGFSYKVPRDVSEVRFSVTIPYFEADLQRFLRKHHAHPGLERGVLAYSRAGRAVEKLRVGRLDGEARFRVLLTARHHACESLASYTLEGLLDAVLASDKDGEWFSENVEFLVVPFMDKDGVEEGDQGKNRRPHDHNRDYLGNSIYPSVRALRALAPQWSDGRLRIALDMHCPYLEGKEHSEVFLVGVSDEEIWANTEDFGRVLEQVQTGRLNYRVANNLPHNRTWNNLTEPRSFSLWGMSLPGIAVSTTIEIPYAEAGGREVNPDTARALGRDLARAIRVYLESEDWR